MDTTVISRVVDLVLIACILAALVATVRMCAADARRRGKSPWLVCLIAVAFFPVGLLAWLVFRPKIVEPERGQKKFELDDFRVQ